MSKSSQVGARASGLELAADLFTSLLVLPIAFLWAALGAADISESDPSIPEPVLVAGAVAVPLVAWGVVVVILIRHWRGGWRRLWSLPLVILVGLLFLPSLLLLTSSGIRRSVLPYKPLPPRTRADAPGLQLGKGMEGR